MHWYKNQPNANIYLGKTQFQIHITVIITYLYDQMEVMFLKRLLCMLTKFAFNHVYAKNKLISSFVNKIF